jgi:hypothetical protein
MNPLLDILRNSAGGGAVQQLSRQFGLSDDQTQGALGQIVPALMAGLQRNTSQEGGMGSLLSALSGGHHQQYVEQPEVLAQETTTTDGNAILGHIFGSTDVSRTVAGRTAEQTGISTDIVKQMLPVVAAMVMGGLSSKQRDRARVPAAAFSVRCWIATGTARLPMMWSECSAGL